MESHKEMMRNYLCEALRQLMCQKLFEKITIKQICDRAGVIRATFYNYFDDKYDCLNTIVYLDLAQVLDEMDRCPAEELLTRTFTVIEKNRVFYRAAYQVMGQNSFEDMMWENLAGFLQRYLEANRDPNILSQYSNEYLSRYYAGGAAFHIKDFIFRREESLTPKDMAERMLDLMNTSLSGILIQE